MHLKINRKALPLNEERLVAHLCGRPTVFQVGATGFEPAASRTRSVHNSMRYCAMNALVTKVYGEWLRGNRFPGIIRSFEEFTGFLSVSPQSQSSGMRVRAAGSEAAARDQRRSGRGSGSGDSFPSRCANPLSLGHRRTALVSCGPLPVES